MRLLRTTLSLTSKQQQIHSLLAGILHHTKYNKNKQFKLKLNDYSPECKCETETKQKEKFCTL